MTIPQIQIQLIASVVAVSCSLLGVFLVLRRLSLMSDAISHAILLGIVIAFLIAGTVQSPLLIIGAAITGVLLVSVVHLLQKTRLVYEDAAIGLSFPAFFSIGVILVARYAGNVHLDIDAVLLGELAFAPLDQLVIAGHFIGPRSLYTMAVICLLILAFISFFYKELKITTFDPGHAAALGFAPGLLGYILMALVSVTAVGAFDAVGSILVVALMIAPAATAYLLTDSLARMLLLSAAIGVASAICGYWSAHFLDVTIAGAMAVMTGLFFVIAFVSAPQRGLLARISRRNRQKWSFAETMLLVHLLHHEGKPEAARECRIEHLNEHINWDKPFTRILVSRALQHKTIRKENGTLFLTEKGRLEAQTSMTR